MKDICLITSVIHTSSAPLSYTDTRSVFSTSERFEQTKNTIQSIKKKLPSSEIIIVECSPLSLEEELYLKENTHYFINLFQDEDCRRKIQGPFKEIGHGTQISEGIKYLEKNDINYDNFFQIDGRYYISDNFDYNLFLNDKIVVKKFERFDNIMTGIIKLPKKISTKFKLFLEDKLIKLSQLGHGFEDIMMIFLREKCLDSEIIYADKIGVDGRCSINGKFTSY